MTVEERVLKVIADEAHKTLGPADLDKPFEEAGLDSLDKVCVMFGLEQEFDINIPEAEAKQITNVRQIIEQLEHWMKSQPVASAAAKPTAAGQ